MNIIYSNLKSIILLEKSSIKYNCLSELITIMICGHFLYKIYRINISIKIYMVITHPIIDKARVQMQNRTTLRQRGRRILYYSFSFLTPLKKLCIQYFIAIQFTTKKLASFFCDYCIR